MRFAQKRNVDALALFLLCDFAGKFPAPAKVQRKVEVGNGKQYSTYFGQGARR